MNQIDIVGFGNANHTRNIEISADGAFACIEFVGFIGFETVGAETVFGRVDGDGGEAKFSCGAKHANRNLAAVGD